jgi:hypothetical protein
VIIAQIRATKNLFALPRVTNSPQENNAKEMTEVSQIVAPKTEKFPLSSFRQKTSRRPR